MQDRGIQEETISKSADGNFRRIRIEILATGRFPATIPSIVPRRKKCKVFVSYSRHDEALVKPLAGLLGVAADDAVFLDVTSVKPGDLWEKEIFDALDEASVFILCWCCQSQASKNVAKEIAVALSAPDKKLVPVLFCAAPLPSELAERQWTDLRGRVVHECSVAHLKSQEKEDGPRPGRRPSVRGDDVTGSARHYEPVTPRSGSSKPKEGSVGRYENPYRSALPNAPAPVAIGFSLRLIGIVALLCAVFFVRHFFGDRTLWHVATWAGGIIGLLAYSLFVWSLLNVKRRSNNMPSPPALEVEVWRSSPAMEFGSEADLIAVRAKKYFEGLAAK